MAKICSLKKINWDWALLWRWAIVIVSMAVSIISWGIIVGIFVGPIIAALIIVFVEENFIEKNCPHP